MAFAGLAIAAALALAKDKLVDQPAADRKRKLAAATERFSPWTGLHAQPVDDPNALGSMMSAGATGAMIGQGVANSNAQNAYLDRAGESDGVIDPNLSQSNSYMAGPNPYAGADAKLDANAGMTGTGQGFTQPSLGASSAGGQQPAWFYGNKSPDDALAMKLATRDPYASLYNANVDPNPPSHYWGQGNPYSNGY